MASAWLVRVTANVHRVTRSLLPARIVDGDPAKGCGHRARKAPPWTAKSSFPAARSLFERGCGTGRLAATLPP